MRYLIQTNATGEMKPEASFRVLGDAIEFYKRCCFAPEDNIEVELVSLETGEVLNVEKMNDNYIEQISDCEVDLDHAA